MKYKFQIKAQHKTENKQKDRKEKLRSILWSKKRTYFHQIAQQTLSSF
jgi:hypothetical protein